MALRPREIICDPACGTGGFLVAVAEYLCDLKDSEGNFVLNAPGNRDHFNSEMFHGFDFDKADAVRRKRQEAIALTEELLRDASRLSLTQFLGIGN